MKLKKLKLAKSNLKNMISFSLFENGYCIVQLSYMKFYPVEDNYRYHFIFRNKNNSLWGGTNTNTSPKTMAKKMLEAFQNL